MCLQTQAESYFSSPLLVSHAEASFSFLSNKQRVFQSKAPTAPGSSTEALFVRVLIAAQTHACVVTVLCKVLVKWVPAA